ncbi:aspartate aminotransferase family protein [Myxococcota bacterium]|nr:aspartate aminotransferase family protein [Myxococcota bacterium]
MARAPRGNRDSERLRSSLATLEPPGIRDPSLGGRVLTRAQGCRLKDVDGNWYVDLSSAFGVAAVGHRHPAVMAAIRRQASRIPHGLGDLHPVDVAERLLRMLSGRLPAQDYRGVLSLNGSDAVETALKFAAAASGRPGILAFEGGYHGLSLGALEATQLPRFRAPFQAILGGRSRAAPFPRQDGSDRDRVLDEVRRLFRTPPVPGVMLIEPIQGRGGIRVPPPGFLRDLEGICREAGVFLVVDEVMTGVHRTGPFLRSQAEGVVPDGICLGKALGGGVPLSACLMRGSLAEALRDCTGEAPHTWTFLGNPLGCAAGIAVLRTMDRENLPGRVPAIEEAIREAGNRWARDTGAVAEIRGAGALMGIRLQTPGGGPPGDLGIRVMRRAWDKGVMLTLEGPDADVLALLPPLSIPPRDLARALERVGDALREEAGR